MSPFEKGSGFSADWVHLVIVAISGTLIIICFTVCIISYLLQMADVSYKFNVKTLLKVCFLVTLLSIVMGVIGSM